MSDFAVYGTPFIELEDEERDAITRRPKGIQDEIVTDEKGRRRFHGAFTGGFSAGYFNTVGSKHGWVPQTFKSSRDSRAEKVQLTAEDLMDDEDVGEFGIASRKIRPKRDFMHAFAAPGEQQLLAWERSTLPSSSNAQDVGISAKLAEIIRPVNSESIGARLLKKMGWREGRGIGPKMKRMALERQKLNELRAQGKKGTFDKEAVETAIEFMPNVEFSPEDIPRVYFTNKEDKHGLGYSGIHETSVLKQNYGEIVSTLKTKQKSKGIRGQAFGVGAFEDYDEDIYTSYDLSQYDFELDTGSSPIPEIARYDSSFVQSTKKSALRKQYPLPKIPHDFRPVHKPIPIDVKRMPEEIRKLGQKMTAMQRAQFLGERDASVMELLSDKDRQKLKRGSSRWDKSAPYMKAETSTSGVEMDPFEEEPMKSHRFKQYIQYLRRGLTMPQPIDMTQLEWEQEVEQFQKHLSPELRALLPEVRMRQQPLAKVAYADTIMEQLKSRFQKETNVSTDDVHEKEKRVKDHDRISAVRMKMFGEKTRIKYEWHPAKELCKHFNIPDPYPESLLVGVPQLQARKALDRKTENQKIVELAGVGLPNTANELAKRRERNEYDRETRRLTEENATVKQEPSEESEIERPMVDLLKAIFDESEESETEKENEDEKDDPSKLEHEKPSTSRSSDQLDRFKLKPIEQTASTKVLTVMDLIESDEEEEFGPKPPPNLPMASEATARNSPEIKFIPRSPTIKQRRSTKEENAPYNAIVILGHSKENAYKNGLLNKLLPTSVHIDLDESDQTFTIFYAGEEKHQTIDRHFSNDFIQMEPIGSQANLTIVFASKGTNEMAIEELSLLHEIIYYLNEGTLVIEIGNPSIQTSTILEHSSFCWGTGKLDIDAPNKIILCNNLQPTSLSIMKNAKIEKIPHEHREHRPSIKEQTFWSAILASAESIEEVKITRRTRHRTIQPNKRKIRLLKQRKRLGKQGHGAKSGPIEEVQIENFEKLTNQDRKLACKYRKSCYETGKIPLLDEIEETDKKADDRDDKDDADDDEDEDLDEYELKLLCKYKPSCYAEIGMPMSDENKQKSAAILSGKKTNLASPELKKKMRRTVKDFAKIALREVEEKREQAAKRPVSQPSIVEQQLQEIEEKLDAKNKCKYRKSCYETGRLPEIDDSFYVPLPLETISGYAASLRSHFVTEKEEKSFEEKKMDEVKVFCKYRKSCYDTGVVPTVEKSKFAFSDYMLSLGSRFEKKDEKSFEEKNPDEVKVYCKYRKSCYDTGKAPEIEKPGFGVMNKLSYFIPIETMLEKAAPATLDDLRLQCKYRTSCYQKKALTETPAKESEAMEAEKDEEEIPTEKQKKTKAVRPPKVIKPEELKIEAANVEKELKSKETKKSKKEKTLKEQVPEPEPEPVVEESNPKKESKKSKEVEPDIHVEEVMPPQEPVSEVTIPRKKPKKSKEIEPEVEAKIEEVEAAKSPKKSKKKKVYLEAEHISKEEPPKATEPTKEEKTPKKLKTPSKEKHEPIEEKIEKIHVDGITREKCKYRKSCYESGILPDLSFESEPTPRLRQPNLHKKTEKIPLEEITPEKCKYRKSCYESGILPDDLSSTKEESIFDGLFALLSVFTAIPSSTTKSSNLVLHPDEPITPEKCKYRKSCYETGVVPEILNEYTFFGGMLTFVHDLGKPSAEKSRVYDETLNERTKEACKYRKSCYAKYGIGVPETTEDITGHKTAHETPAPKKALHEKVKKSDEPQEATAEEKEEKHDKKKKGGEKKKPKENKDDEPEKPYMQAKEEETPENKHALAKNLTSDLKVACKYRHSCYKFIESSGSISPELKEKLMRLRGEECNRFRISCREKLGLPFKERAPIGPDGRRLCRKKKPVNDTNT